MAESAERAGDTENTIRPSRRRARPAASESVAAKAPTSSATTEAHPTQLGRWAVPDEVKRLFVQVGRTYYFPDGARAFEDRGKRLVTRSENTEVIRALIGIAQARGWADITVTGTDRFRTEAWHQAEVAGLIVRGYKPDERDRVRVVRALASEGNATIGSPAPGSANATDGKRRQRDVLIVGKLLQHGPAAYRFDSREQPSYYVKLETDAGERILWGKDLQRAIADSVTKPQVGDEVGIRPIGRDAVSVRTPERNAAGEVTGEHVVTTHRNRWLVEKRSFFDERAAAARALRDPGTEPKQAAQQHPELVSEYLKLRGAELIAERNIGNPDDRRKFVDLVRDKLATTLARGDRVAPLRLREHSAQQPPQSPPQASEREQVHVRG